MGFYISKLLSPVFRQLCNTYVLLVFSHANVHKGTVLICSTNILYSRCTRMLFQSKMFSQRSLQQVYMRALFWEGDVQYVFFFLALLWTNVWCLLGPSWKNYTDSDCLFCSTFPCVVRLYMCAIFSVCCAVSAVTVHHPLVSKLNFSPEESIKVYLIFSSNLKCPLISFSPAGVPEGAVWLCAVRGQGNSMPGSRLPIPPRRHPTGRQSNIFDNFLLFFKSTRLG